jgi:hypothetical protein
VALIDQVIVLSQQCVGDLFNEVDVRYWHPGLSR